MDGDTTDGEQPDPAVGGDGATMSKEHMSSSQTTVGEPPDRASVEEVINTSIDTVETTEAGNPALPALTESPLLASASIKQSEPAAAIDDSNRSERSEAPATDVASTKPSDSATATDETQQGGAEWPEAPTTKPSEPAPATDETQQGDAEWSEAPTTDLASPKPSEPATPTDETQQSGAEWSEAPTTDFNVQDADTEGTEGAPAAPVTRPSQPTTATAGAATPGPTTAGAANLVTVQITVDDEGAAALDSFADLLRPDSFPGLSTDQFLIQASEGGSTFIIRATSEAIRAAQLNSSVFRDLMSTADLSNLQLMPVGRGPVLVSPIEYDRTQDEYLTAENRLSEVDAHVVYILLEEYLQQLEVLGKIISAPFVTDYENDDETLRQRFRRQEDAPLKIEGTRTTAAVSSNQALAKIQQDRGYEHKVHSRLMQELRRDGSYAPLIAAVEAEALRRQEYVLIEEEAIANSETIGRLQREIKDLKASMTVEIADRNARIFQLRDELQEVLARTGMEVRYTANSMATKQDMDVTRMNFKRERLEERALQLLRQYDLETRANQEVGSYLQDATQKLNEVLDNRLTQFDQDTDEKEREINNLKYKKQQNFQALTEARDNYALYSRVVAEDDDEQRLEEQRLALEERRLRAATLIQACWLGYRERKKFKKKLKKIRKAAKKAAKEAAMRGGPKRPAAPAKKPQKKK